MEVDMPVDPFQKFDPWSREEDINDPAKRDLLRQRQHGQEGRGKAAGRLAYDPQLKASNPCKERYIDAADPFCLDTVGQRRSNQQQQRPQDMGAERRSIARPRVGNLEKPRREVEKAGFLRVQPPGRGPRWVGDGPADPPGAEPPRLLRDEDLRRVIVMGAFRPRTRTAVATREAMQVLQLLGLDQDVEELLGGPSTAKVIRVRLLSGQALSAAINRARARPVASDLTISGQIWINRARTQAEAARVSPLSRCVRALQTHLEAARLGRRDLGWKPEADSGPGSEAVYVSWDNFTPEEKFVWRDAQSAWRIDDHLWAALDMEHVFLAGLM